jgi:hypothetical protein
MTDLIRLGDTSNHGGEVVTASQTMRYAGRCVAREGDLVKCGHFRVFRRPYYPTALQRNEFLDCRNATFGRRRFALCPRRNDGSHAIQYRTKQLRPRHRRQRNAHRCVQYLESFHHAEPCARLYRGGRRPAAAEWINAYRHVPDSASAGNQNQWFAGTASGSSMTIPLTVQYVRTADAMTPGTVRGLATFTIAYE